MKEQLIHILDESVCLSRRQLKDYLEGTMLPIENHAVEVHLNSCPLCRMAVEGFEENIGDATAALESLNSNFLKEHFDKIAPQIHLNSMSPAAALSGNPNKKVSYKDIWRTTTIAATILLAFGVLWYLEFGENAHPKNSRIALNTPEKNEAPSSISPRPTVEQIAGTSATTEQPNTTEHSIQPKGEKPALVAQENASGNSSNLVADKDLGDAKAPPSKPFQGNDELTAASSIAKNIKPSAVAIPSKEAVSPGENPTEIKTRKKTLMTEQSVAKQSSSIAEKSSRAVAVSKSLNQSGDDYFEAGDYEKALADYSRQMQTGTKDEQSTAAIKAAKCYAILGNKTRATELLKYIIATGDGHHRRAAKKALRALNKD